MMTPELWERLNPLFNQLMESPASERKALIDGLCGGDVMVRRELTALVEAHEAESSRSGGVDAKIRSAIRTATLGRLTEGQLVQGRFKIVKLLGSGGMGDVYEAVDIELSQAVALKVIRPEIAANDEILTRFKKEVQLARRLNGPNICRIHELFVFKSATGEMSAFLTMELLHGITLADRAKRGPVAWRDAETIAIDICDGLSAMHRSGIIHRDLKSRNIMLAERDGATRAVLMDFGLAREMSSPAAEAQTGWTMPGAVLGTPEYMAPEQFQGAPVTPATDIFAAGIVLYELVTGTHPFASTNVLGSAVLRGRRPVSPSSLSRGLPHRWEAAIYRCLEYEASRRFQSADLLARALRKRRLGFQSFQWHQSRMIAVGTSLILILTCLWFVPTIRERLQGIVLSDRVKHIAVLPFDVAGDNQDAAILADGLMDSLTGKLTNLGEDNQSLWVVPASEVRRRKVGDPATALKEFGATMVVKGHFRRQGATAHLDLELIDARKMREIGFADVENRDEDLSELQDDAIATLGRMMNVKTSEQAVRGGEEGVGSAAYKDYITALGYMERYDKQGNLEAAIQSLSQAVRESPRFALALGKLGQAYTLKYRIDANPDSLKLARDFSSQAIAIDGHIPSLFATLAYLDYLTGKDELAAEEFRHVIELDPTNVEALTGLANIYQREGKNADAEEAHLRAIQLRPEDWTGYNLLGNYYDEIGKHREAIGQLLHAIQLSPDNAFVYCNLGTAYVNSGDPKLMPEAEKALQKSISLNPTYQAYAELGNLFGNEQRFKESADMAEKALQLDDQDFEIWNNLSQAYEGMGDEGKATNARKQAIILAERALKLNPKSAEAHAMLAELSAKENSLDAARHHLKAALALAPTDQDVLSEAAETYELLGDRGRAIEYLELAMRNGYPPNQVNGDVVLKEVWRDPRFHK